MDWKTFKDLGPFEFEKTTAGVRYNTGNAIVDAYHPVWNLNDKTGIPITPTHEPCGYWSNSHIVHGGPIVFSDMVGSQASVISGYYYA